MAFTRTSGNLRVVLALPAVSGIGPVPRRRRAMPVPTGNIVVNGDEVDRPLPAVPVQLPIPRGQPQVPSGIVAKANEIVPPQHQKKVDAKAKKKVAAKAEKKVNAKAQEEREDKGPLLPEGTPLLSVAGEPLPKSAVGPALEFIEFYSAFYEPLEMKEVEAQVTLREIVRGCKLKKTWQSQVVRVHVRLLSLILSDESVSPKLESENSWLIVLKSYLDMKSQSRLQDPQLKDAEDEQRKTMDVDTECSPKPPPSSDSVASPSNSTFSSFQKSMQKYATALDGGADGYLSLAVEEKLQILNVLCNDALSTAVLKDHIDKLAPVYDEKSKGGKKKKIKAGKSKATALEFSTEDKRTGSVRTRSARTQESANLPETLDSGIFGNTEILRQVKTEAIVWSNGSHALWKLKGGDDRNAVIFQVLSDIGGTPKEEWTVYSEKDKEAVAGYLDQK